MGKTPITCPSCDTEFVGQAKPVIIESLDEAKTEADAEKVIDATAAAANKSDSDDEDEDEELISLDEVEEGLDDDDDDSDDAGLEDGDLDFDKTSPKKGDE
jgi:uncharacterized Zn finger protein (UPF0148 family)|tara:strand:- start:134284 stop:134586 length:303 start_codon:yes stop_codon:yes gene_type:complete